MLMLSQGSLLKIAVQEKEVWVRVNNEATSTVITVGSESKVFLSWHVTYQKASRSYTVV